jgi:hypothetical protein
MQDKFLFNPFNVINVSDEQLKDEYVKIANTLRDIDVPFEIALNIERYANLRWIVGEMVARYKHIVADDKTEYKAKLSLQIYKDRDIWIKTNTGKAPAMSYFEAKAYEFVREDRIKLNQTIKKLDTFTNSWNTLEDKGNALKKMYDAKKYEIGIGR